VTRRPLVLALAGEALLLAVLAATAGVGLAGIFAGAGYATALCLLLAHALGPDTRSLGPANVVTLVRAVLIGGVTAQVADGLATGTVHVPVLVSLACVALALDGVDGQVARRTHTVSPLGARFDMEADASLLLVLSVHVATEFGLWVLAIGAMRYLWLAAGRLLWPWLRAPLPARYSAKVVAVAQAIALIVAGSGLLSATSATGLLAMALGLLLWSFGVSGVQLWQRHAGLDNPTADSDAEHAPGTRLLTRVLNVLALALVVAALIVPSQLSDLGVGMLFVPLEGVLTAAALLVLPPLAGRVLTNVFGVVLGMHAVLTVLDVGFLAVLARPFDPTADWGLTDSMIELLSGSLGRQGAVAALVAGALLLVGLLVAVMVAVRRCAEALIRHRTRASRVLAAAVPVCLVSVLVGAQIIPAVPVSSAAVTTVAVQRVQRWITAAGEQQAFETACLTDPVRDVAPGRLLGELRGKDVVLAFLESYGRVSIEEPTHAAAMQTTLEGATRRLAGAGFGARSGFLTSPVSGGGSWLAHATVQSGLWVNREQRYVTLEASSRATLTGAFRSAGWRTVAVMPGNVKPWPKADFYPYDRVLDDANLGYRGPDLGWASTPDQYSLAAFERAEHGVSGRGPLFTQIALVSSHAPWPIIPDVIPWQRVGDGSVYQTMTTGEPRDAIWAKGGDAVRTAYRRSLQYSIDSLIFWLTTYGSKDTVVIVLGDHQPPPVLTRVGAGRDVPVSIIAGDPAVLDRIADWGWTPGLKPESTAPVWRMDAFRDRFLTAFSR